MKSRIIESTDSDNDYEEDYMAVRGVATRLKDPKLAQRDTDTDGSNRQSISQIYKSLSDASKSK